MKNEFEERVKELLSEYYKKALQKNPASDSAHFNLGAVYQQLGQKEKALDEFKTTLSLNPNHDKAKTAIFNLLTPVKSDTGQIHLQ